MPIAPITNALVRQFESFRPNAYLDVGGVPTIGWGFTQGVHMGDTITMEDAIPKLAALLQDFSCHVSAMLIVTPTDEQLGAMTSLAYNIGSGNFHTSSVLRHHNLGNFAEAKQDFLMWDEVKGQEVDGIKRRRVCESVLYAGGDPSAFNWYYDKPELWRIS